LVANAKSIKDIAAQLKIVLVLLVMYNAFLEFVDKFAWIMILVSIGKFN
jgi:hypothetical protein